LCQAEDGIRDRNVTGVQTCALPISERGATSMANELTAAQRVALARHPERPGTAEFIEHLFTDFFEQRGDRLCAEDGSILGGIAQIGRASCRERESAAAGGGAVRRDR